MVVHTSLRTFALATAALCLATSFGAGAAVALSPADLRLPPSSESLTEQDKRLLTDERLLRLYRTRGFLPIWLNAGMTGLNPRGELVLRRLREADREGLEPASYRVSGIEAAEMAGDWEELDLLLSAGLLDYAGDMANGRAETRKRWEDLDGPEATDPVAVVRDLLVADDPAAALESVAPRHPQYSRLRQALAEIREVAAEGGWPTIPPGETLDPGMRDPRVGALRKRLAATEGVELEPAEPEFFDPPLEAAVRMFQERNGLAADGRVGPKTLSALNRSAEDLVKALEANMERWRWLPRDLGERYLLVNIPAYELEAAKQGEVVLRMPVIAGIPSRATPLFSDRLEYLEANPTWTVPPTIFAKDYLPRLRQDPSYLAKKNITLYASWSGGAAPVDPYSVDWHAVRGSTRSLSWRLVQAPGPSNALGRIKFMMPNRHSIYLHDTPEKRLFGRANRALSSGCVRVADPDALAELVLEGTSAWDTQRLEGVYASGRTARINLERQWPVHIAYFTTWVGDDGVLHFYDDVYGRDAEMIELMGQETLALAEEPTMPPSGQS